MDDDATTSPLEPARWYLIFSTETDRRFLRWAALGRYKHVMAVGYVPSQELWIVVNPKMRRTVVEAVRDGSLAVQRLTDLMGSHEVLMLPAQEPTWRLKPGLWCVPIVAHLVGVSSCALRPDAFHRDCLAAGAERLTLGNEEHGPVRAEPRTEGRPEACS